MSVHFTAEEAVPGNPEQLQNAARVLKQASGDADELVGRLGRTIAGTESDWEGDAGNAYRTSATRQVSALGTLPGTLSPAASVFSRLADEIAAAQGIAREAMAGAEKLGLAPGDLVGRPWNVAMFVMTHPQHGPQVAALIGEVVRARLAANQAQNDFVAGMASMRDGIADADDRLLGDRRMPDERGGRRIASDELFRRSEGGDRDGSHFDTDWAGRAILERYLRGGEDWVITNDPDWSRYMMNNQTLRGDLLEPAQVQAQQALTNYLDGKGPNGTFDERFHTEIENGEGIVGYQYLHGTDSEAGDFEYGGATQVRPRADGNYEVIIDGDYTWNDNIDPNPKYGTDTAKSRIAELLTLGQADPYRIEIGWEAETTVVLDPRGNVVDVRGYPGK